MNLSTWSIRHPVPPIALFVVLCVAGLVSFVRLPVTQMPNVDLPVVLVSVSAAGTAPSEMAAQVVQPIEDALSGIAGLRHIEASAQDGIAQLTIQFEFGTNTDRALNDVKDAVTTARASMPDTATDPVVQRLDFTGRPILTYAISDQTRSIEELSSFIDDVVARALQGGAGVGSVSRLGGAEREIRVDLDPDRLLALNLSATAISQQLAQTNLDQGGGQGDLFGSEYVIRALGSASTLAQLAATPIRLPTGQTVPLNQLGTVTDGAGEASTFALFDGRPVVAFGVFRATGASDLVAAESAQERLAELQAQYPDTEFLLIDDATIYTESNFHAAMDTLYEGALLAMIVVFLFLRNWRATVVAFVALPLSAIPTFIVMDLLGFSLNTISLLGITLVVGILVDDAIVEIENIDRHIDMGRPAYEAAMEAATEIGTTVIAISLTIVAVFAPVSFMGGIAGEFFKQFGLTVAVAVLFSLAVARLITPLFAAHFMRSKPHAVEVKDGAIMRAYLAALRWTLRNRTITLLAGLVIFGLSIYSATLLPQEFVPPSDQGRSVVVVDLAPGTTLAEARTTAQAITARIQQVPEVERVFVDGRSGTSLSIQVNYGDKSDRERSWTEINADIERQLADLPDVRVFVLGAEGQREITINVLADTEAGASAAANALLREMRGVPLIRNASSEAALLRPEIQIIPDPERAAGLGVTAATLAAAVRVATIGDSDANLAQFDAGEERIPIRVRLNEAARSDISRMAGFRVPSSSGAMVPLSAVADIRLASGVSLIERYDRRYRVSIQADLAPGAYLGPATQAIDALPAASNMPEGTTIQPSGDVETMVEIFSSFALAMGSGLMLVYVVLVLLFNSFVTPLTVMLSLPLAIGGAIFALYLYGSGIGLSVVIGFLMLMGIVTKNAIMLVEFAKEGVHRGMDRASAMIDAGHKRARPIVMTTIAMTAGMVPSALAVSTGGEFRAPMAVAVIGGLLLSTALSLLFVPSVFSVIEGLRDRLGWLLGKLLGGDSLSAHRRH